MDPVALVGLPASDFSRQDLDGRTYRLGDQRGRIVVLDFWSAECPHAERADAILARLRPAWGERVVVWRLASNANEDEEQLRRTARQRRIGPVLRDIRQVVADRYRARTTPHVFIVDEQGILRYAGAPDDVTFGQRAPTRTYVEDAVRALLQGKAPDPDSTAPYGCAIVRGPGGLRSATSP